MGMASASRKNQFKVVLLGEGCVGKTSLMLRYVQDKFNDKHLTTLQVGNFLCCVSRKPGPEPSHDTVYKIWKKGIKSYLTYHIIALSSQTGDRPISSHDS